MPRQDATDAAKRRAQGRGAVRGAPVGAGGADVARACRAGPCGDGRGVLRGGVFGSRLARARPSTRCCDAASGRGAVRARAAGTDGRDLRDADGAEPLRGGQPHAALRLRRREARVAHHRGALPHVADVLDGLDIAGVRRAPLWARAVGAHLSPAAGPSTPNKNRSVSSRFTIAATHVIQGRVSVCDFWASSAGCWQ